MSSTLGKTGLLVLAALSSMSLIANQVTVTAQGDGEGIAPVNSNTGLPSSSQSSQSVVVVTITGNPDSGLDPSPFVPSSIQSSSSASAITVTASAATVTASAVTVTASASATTASAVTVTASANTVTASASTVTTSVDLAALLYSLPAEQAVITQAPCVSACLQAAVIASAAGPCGRTAGVAIDNGCGCLSAPLNALQALTNCASAACIGQAAGTMDPASGSVVVSSLYNAYCLTAVNAAAFSAATAATSSDAATQTTTSEPNTASVGSVIPAFTSGNSTFNGVITPTVTTTSIFVTASAPAPPATTTNGGETGGNNTGGHSGAGRGVSDKLTMTIFTAGFVVILSKLLL